MFEFLETSLKPDADADCAAFYIYDVVVDPPATASYLEVSIPTALLIKRSQSYTLDNDSGIMGHNCRTWMLNGLDTAAWNKLYCILLQLQTTWAYRVVSDFYHHLPLLTWVSYERCHLLLLQVHTGREFGVVGDFSISYARLSPLTLKSPPVVIPMIVRQKVLSYRLSHHYIL